MKSKENKEKNRQTFGRALHGTGTLFQEIAHDVILLFPGFFYENYMVNLYLIYYLFIRILK